jgi:hypothetical protein
VPIFPQAGRLDELRRLGLSDPLVRLAGGELVHPAFDPRFVGPPMYVYGRDEDAVSVPDGPSLVPLWSFADGVQGVWEVGDALQFIDYDIEAPDEFEIIARTEQGFLAWMFITLHEHLWDDRDDFEALAEAAEVVGYRHYGDWLAALAGAEISDVNDWGAFCTLFVEGIDQLKTSRDRRRR